MLIAEDVLLLLLDDEEGTLRASTSVQTVLGGAVLSELALAGAVEVGEREGFWQTAKVRTVDPAPPDARLDDDVLREGLATIAGKERSAADLVDRLGRGLEDRLTERLEARGLLRREERKVLGLFRSTRWPAIDTAHEQQVRAALTAALVQGQDPDPRTATLVALLHAVGEAHRCVEAEGMSRREVTRRAKAVAEGQWAPEGVADAIAAANAAVIAATVAATSAATTTTSST